jgi:hypothetical protein
MANKKKPNKLGGIFLTIFITLIMVTSIIGFLANDSSTRVIKYNKQKFTGTNDGWMTKYEGKTYYFSYVPNDLEDLEFPEIENLDSIIELDVTYDENSTSARDIAGSIFELSEILFERGTYLRQGFTKNNTLNRPIITCKDALPSVPVVYFKESNITKISIENYCIIVQAQDSRSFLPVANRIAYKILGIM